MYIFCNKYNSTKLGVPVTGVRSYQPQLSVNSRVTRTRDGGGSEGRRQATGKS